ncbi:hypothetical protein C8Q80DRAFT_1220069 [Daedaleopsis nitida]|nr:hypothetical protein C8Q80DRAFT_1220069 [Daedaleopsis nitida]
MFALRDLLDSRLGYQQYRDTRTWQHRIHVMDTRWQEQLPMILDSYMRWKDDHTPPSPTADLPSNSNTHGADIDAEGDAVMSEYDFQIDCIDFEQFRTSVTIRRCPHESPAVALINNGFPAATPVRPTIAVSLKTLELFYDIRRVKASFSVEAFTKLIPFRRRFRKAISDTFDVYLLLMDQVHRKVQEALGRDAPNWRVRHACPACSYKVEGETPATYERMIVMDGNNSLKCVATGARKVGDTRKFTKVVERFTGEVKRRPQPHVEVPPEHNPDDSAGDPTDGAPDSSCTSNWKAVAADDKKRMWAIFEETGIFAAACRHGFIVWLIDMVRSGELAKYPLAITSRVIEVIREAIMLGFDIGCTFKITLKNSSLGPAFEALGGRVCVNAFHGYSHSYPCQLHNHLNGIVGMGLEDLETLERVFSASNQLASVTRYASAYRRGMLIHAYFRQWDEDKYANQGLFLYNNYAQALDILKTKKPVLNESMALLDLTLEKLKEFERKEVHYFDNLRDEAPWDLHAIAYVEALQELGATSKFLTSAPPEYTWLSPNSGPTDYYGDASATVRLEGRRRELDERVTRLTSQVIAMEVQMNITVRWRPGDKEYEETARYIDTRRYQQALGRLQRLVIQRLFELHRLNVAQTAYRMRTQIAKSLQKRSKAIRTAVKQLNSAGAAIGRPPVDFDAVTHYGFLEEFTLLQDTRNDIRSKPWAQPLIRETMRTARRLKRAEEEIVNVNREARRVHTSIVDEDALFSDVLNELRSHGDIRFGVVYNYIRRRRMINAFNLAHLRRLYALDGFTGEPTPGTHAGPPREQPLPAMPASPPGNNIVPESQPSTATIKDLARLEESALEDNDANEDVLVDEDEDGAVTDLAEHMSNIAVVM